MQSSPPVNDKATPKPNLPASWSLEMLAREPFRVFFPAATLAGILGVALWPLHLTGVMATYPGQFHARIMAHGLFGGFIFGFLGTAMPRILSAKQFRPIETFSLLGIHLAMVAAYLANQLQCGNGLFLLLIAGFACCMFPRLLQRKDVPPPGFVLVAASLFCSAAGAALTLFEDPENRATLLNLEHLLTYQGFILFPILGIGPFILPRFFGLESTHDFPESIVIPQGWRKKAALAAAVAVVVMLSFGIEAKGFYRIAYGLRFLATLAYLLREMPLKKGPARANIFGAGIRIALIGMVAGFLAVALFPAYRVGLLHVTLVGGFAIITFVVATRVVFGHSGNLPLLKNRNRWFAIALGIMLFGMTTRISGDFWPKIMASHYIYGAILWIAGVLVWAAYVLPKVLREEEE